MSKSVAIWLFACAAFVIVATQVGAITRLTESGLSIVEWKPVRGALPPLNELQWQDEFSRYQTSPQYKQVNEGMSLEDFKKIYFWEWLHRLLDRLLGLAYFLPLAWFWKTGKIPAETRKPLAGIFLLGAAQGALGWIMVKSGLESRPSVSHYLLAAHLMLAMVIFCCMLRMAFIFNGPRTSGSALVPIRALVRLAVGFVAVTMTWGAFTAGLRAGVLYGDTFPMMGTHLWPGEMFNLSPLWHNFFENPAAVQFIHRVLAIATFVVLMTLSARGLMLKPSLLLRLLLIALCIMACAQVGLGIATLLTHVNIVVATLHQAGAIIILALLMALLHNIPRKGEGHEFH
jgi:cytochrome c oxidase assembly protein subunit 15